MNTNSRIIGARIVCNHGKNDQYIYPVDSDVEAHISRISESFTPLSMERGSIRPDVLVEMLFEVPVGRIVEFEQLVGSYRHGRVFRPN